MTTWQASETRYDSMIYRRCGRSGLKLPLISLGLWHNFGHDVSFERSRAIALKAFDLGVTHFDLGNNYGPPPGAAEATLGRLLRTDLAPYRDELVISTKAGFDMWPGPYGNWGSRKYLLASLDQSLERLGLDYVDIFYSHRPDPETPLEETMGALDQAVRSGKALYAGISSYQPEATERAAEILREMGTPCLIHQANYSMVNRWIENGLLFALERQGMGCIAFCPLAQGRLTSRYLEGTPSDSRAAQGKGTFGRQPLREEDIARAKALNEVAGERGQTLSQMALAWTVRDEGVTSALIGASRPEQVEENVAALSRLDFSPEEVGRIEEILNKYQPA